MHLFFSSIRVHNPDRFPKSGPVLVVANHHSSLVDPVALIARLPRMPRFLAKSALWDTKFAPLRPFLWLAGAIPVHRTTDGGGDNSKMFAASQAVLANDGVIAVFAEGASHDMAGLLALKTGSARLALGTVATVQIVPVGLIYDSRAKYRSRAMVYVGKPILVEGSTDGDQDRATVSELTAEIGEALSAVAPSWDSWEAHDNARIAARVLSYSEPSLDYAQVLTALNEAVDQGGPGPESMGQAVRALKSETQNLGLDIETVIDQPAGSAKDLSMGWIETAVWTLPVNAGRFLNRPPFLLIRLLANTQDLNFQATFKILAGVFLYPVWWAALAAAAFYWYGSVFALATFVLVPLAGYIAARKAGRLRRLRNRETLGDAKGLEPARDWVISTARSIVTKPLSG